MAFRDIAGEIGLQLPYNGRTYSIPPVDAELGPQVQALFDVMIGALIADKNGDEAAGPTDETRELLDDLAERQLYRDVLGHAYEEMVADRVPWAVLKRAALAAMTDACMGREQAEAAWNGDPVDPPANRATKRAAARSVPARKGRAVSTGGTTSPAKPKKAATPSRGRGSSTRGSSSS